MCFEVHTVGGTDSHLHGTQVHICFVCCDPSEPPSSVQTPLDKLRRPLLRFLQGWIG